MDSYNPAITVSKRHYTVIWFLKILFNFTLVESAWRQATGHRRLYCVIFYSVLINLWRCATSLSPFWTSMSSTTWAELCDWLLPCRANHCQDFKSQGQGCSWIFRTSSKFYSFNMIFLQILLQRYIIKHRVTIPCKRYFNFTWNLLDFRWNPPRTL